MITYQNLAGSMYRKQKAWGFIFLIPAYIFFIPRIVSALLVYFIAKTNFTGGELVTTLYLNCIIGFINLLLCFLIFRNFIKDNWVAFKNQCKEHILWTITIGYGVLLALSAASNGLLVLILQEEMGNSANQSLFLEMQQMAPVWMFVQAVFIAPIVEELLFRGLIFRTLFSKNKYIAHIISSFLFGFIHVYQFILEGDLTQWLQLIPYMCMGLAFSYAYEKRGTIFSPILLHFVNNLIAFIVACNL